MGKSLAFARFTVYNVINILRESVLYQERDPYHESDPYQEHDLYLILSAATFCLPTQRGLLC